MNPSWKTTYAGSAAKISIALAVLSAAGAIRLDAAGHMSMPPDGAPWYAWMFFGLYIVNGILQAIVQQDKHPTPPPIGPKPATRRKGGK